MKIDMVTLDHYIKALQGMAILYVNLHDETERKECKCRLEGMMASGAELLILWKLPLTLGWKYPCLDMLESYYLKIRDSSEPERKRLVKEAMSNFDNDLRRLLTPEAKKTLKALKGAAKCC